MQAAGRVGAVVLVVATLFVFGGQRADATPYYAYATNIVASSTCGKRQTAWANGHSVYLQHLDADGSTGERRIGVATYSRDSQGNPTMDVGDDISVGAGCGGTVVGYPIVERGPGSARSAHDLRWIGNDGTSFLLASVCTHPTADDLNDHPGAVAVAGEAFLAAGPCEGGIDVVHGGTAEGDTQERRTITVDGEVSGVVVAASPKSTGWTVVWQHVGPGGDQDIGVQRFNALGTPIGQPLVVATGPGDQTEPAVAANGNRYLIAWVDGGSLLMGRSLGSTGLGAPTTLVDASGSRSGPSVAAAPSGGWHLAWTDLRSGGPELYLARVNRDQSIAPAGGQVAAGAAPQGRPPSVARGSTDGAGTVAPPFVVYIDYEGHSYNVVGSTSAPTGTATIVTVDPK